MVRKKTKSIKKFFVKACNFTSTILLTLLLLWGLQACSKVNSTTLKFAQLSDIHFLQNGSNTTYKVTAESPRLLDDAVQQINDVNDLDFVMVTGDLIDKPFEKELSAVLPHLNNINIPWYFAFGNHDRCIGGYLTTLVYLDKLRQNNKDFKFNKSYYSFTPKKGYKVIVLDDIITDVVTANGKIDSVQLSWLKNELDKSKNLTVLIFMHVPVIEPIPSPHHRLLNGSEVQHLIEGYDNPIGVFQGHYHCTKVIQHKNVLYVSSPALVTYPNAFRIVSVTNYKDKTSFELTWKETKLLDVQRMAKLLLFSSSLYSGEEADRTGVYTIEK